jgi:hypothetical protein
VVVRCSAAGGFQSRNTTPTHDEFCGVKIDNAQKISKTRDALKSEKKEKRQKKEKKCVGSTCTLNS